MPPTDRIRDFGDVVDAIQAMELAHAERFSRLATTVSDLAETTKDATDIAANEIRALTKQLIEHPLQCPIRPELKTEIENNKKEINRLSVFAGKLVGSVIGWGAAAGLAGYFFVRWLDHLLSNGGAQQ